MIQPGMLYVKRMLASSEKLSGLMETDEELKG
jgi:hypothetical protein